MNEVGVCKREDCANYSNKWPNNCKTLVCYVRYDGLGCPFFKTHLENHIQQDKLRDKGHWVAANKEEYEKKMGQNNT